MIKSFISRFRGSDYAKNTAILTLGTTIAQSVAIVAMPMMSRIYTPADFGILALFSAVANIVATTITLRYETTIILPKKDGEALSLVLLCLFLALFFGLILGVIMWQLPVSIRAMLGVSALGIWLPASVLVGTATSVIAIGMAWLNRKSAYIKMAQLRIIQNILGVLLGISLGLYGFKKGLLLAQIVSITVIACIFLKNIPIRRIFSKTKELLYAGKKQSATPKYLLPTAVLDVITLQLPVLLITSWFGIKEAGQFSMAWKILALPMSLIGGSMGQVFMQRFSKVWPNTLEAKRILFRTWKMLVLVGILPTMLVVIFGKQLFVMILGDAWSDAGRIASLIAPMLFGILISSPTSGIFLVLGLQKYSLIFGVSFLLYRTGCIYFGVRYGNLYYGLTAWVVCELAAISIYNLIALRRMRQM